MYNWKGKTILIAEDETINFMFLKAVLAKTQANIVHATNGQAVIDYMTSNGVADLILMDMKMPVVDGYTATRFVKQNWQQVPIIAQTAYALLGEKEHIMNAGCDDYISKPYIAESILYLIDKWI